MPNKTQVKGKLKEDTGAIREKAGKATGNREMEGRGAVQKNEGKLEGVAGKVKEVAEGLKNKVT